MKTEDVIAARVVNTLLTILALDRYGLQELVEQRVRTNDQVAAHPTIAVLEENGIPKLGILGMLHGVLGSKHKLTAIYNDSSRKLISFAVTAQRKGSCKECGEKQGHILVAPAPCKGMCLRCYNDRFQTDGE